MNFNVGVSYLCYEIIIHLRIRKLACILLFLDSSNYRKSSDVGRVADIYKHLRKRIKQFLHHSGHATCVSEDSEQFKQVVAAFDEFEQ